MGISQSNLATSGFDYVVAVTQDGINSSLMEYLYGGLPEVVLCYIYDGNNNPTPTGYTQFVASANNTDPFSVPDGTPSTDPRIQNLNNAAFAFAIKAKLGLPPGIPPTKWRWQRRRSRRRRLPPRRCATSRLVRTSRMSPRTWWAHSAAPAPSTR